MKNKDEVSFNYNNKNINSSVNSQSIVKHEKVNGSSNGKWYLDPNSNDK